MNYGIYLFPLPFFHKGKALRVSIQILCLLLFSSLGATQTAWAVSHYQEQRYARQLMQTVTVGKPIMLKTDSDEFLAIYTSANTPRARGGVILLHDIGAHPDWPQLIGPLRTRLPDYGWNTLSLQLPLLSEHPNAREYLALFEEANTRIKAGIKFFSDKGILNIVLVGHSLGGAMGLSYLANAKNLDSKVIAFVGIAMYDHDQIDASLTGDTLIGKLTIPVLDIFGSQDRRVVLDAAAARARAARKAHLTNYRQIELTGGDHFFTGLEKTLIKRIRVWLNKQAPGMEITSETFVTNPKNPNNRP